MANYRIITGNFRNFLTDKPYAYAEVNIRLIQNTYTINAGFPAHNQTFGLDSTGSVPVGLELWCNGDGLVSAQYEVKEPDGKIWQFYLNYDDGSPISLQALRAGGAEPDNPATVNSLIAEEISTKTLRIDQPQSLTDGQKAQVRANIGGLETVATSGALINSAGTATPNDSDFVATAVSGGILKKISWTNVKTFLKTYFDGFYILKNSAIIGATKTKVTYDAKGLITGGADATQDDIGDGATYKQFSGTEKTKLSGIAANATANDTDANLKNRTNHTGTQTASTISDFAATVRSSVLTGLSTATNAAIAATDSVLAAFGKLQAQIIAIGRSIVEAHTTDYILTSSDAGKTLTNEGVGVDGDPITFTLPPADESLLPIKFCVVDQATVSIQAADGDLILWIAANGSSALSGHVYSNVPGAHITLKAINTGAWVVESIFDRQSWDNN